MNCHNCSEDIRQLSYATFVGVSDNVEIQIINMPFYNCSKCNFNTYPYPDFGSDLRIEIFGKNKLPLLIRKGIFRKKNICINCNSIIYEIKLSIIRIKLDIKLKNLNPFSLELKVPGMKCPFCSKEQISNIKHISSYISDAIINSFKINKLSPR